MEHDGKKDDEKERKLLVILLITSISIHAITWAVLHYKEELRQENTKVTTAEKDFCNKLIDWANNATNNDVENLHYTEEEFKYSQYREATVYP